MTHAATHAQQAIQDFLHGWRQLAVYAQQVGAFGTVKPWTEPGPPTSPARPVAAKSTEEEDPSPSSKTPRYQDWSDNVTEDPGTQVQTSSAGRDVATPESFPMDEWRIAYQEFLMRKARLDEDTKWCEEFKAQMDRISGGAEYLTLDGREVATYKRNGNLNLTNLEKEHPDVVARYTRLVTEMKFDRESFEEQEPELFALYRAKVFRISNKSALINLK